MSNNAVNEAQTEAVNDDALVGFALVKRRGKADPREQFLVSTLGDFLNFLKAIGATS